ncbi:MAG: FAD-dependent oxidoreductase [Pseudonocardiaceae bacterium]
MNLAIVGGGLAGALLAWRLTQRPYQLRPDLFVSELSLGADATGASGGLIRAFEADPAQCVDAATSLAELLADPMLQTWADYRQVGSVYALNAGTDPSESLTTVASAVPGSAQVAAPRDLPATHPLRLLPDDVVCVIERRAGYLSPQRLRTSVLRKLAADGLPIHRVPVAEIRPDPAVCLPDGTVAPYDAVVVAVGAWTALLLRRSGLPTAGLRTKQIQYTVCRAQLCGVGTFVDETSGLYGRPDEPGTVLLGLPCDRWDLEPDAAIPDVELTARVLKQATMCFGSALTSVFPERVVAAVDSYADPPGLRLRSILPDSPLYTFTGGSGISAKAALAASRTAAAALVP